MLLEFEAEVGGVGGVFLGLTESGWGAVGEVDGGIVLGDEGVGGVFGDPGEDFFATDEELGEGAEAEGVAAVFAVGGPLDHLLGIESGLGAGDGSGL